MFAARLFGSGDPQNCGFGVKTLLATSLTTCQQSTVAIQHIIFCQHIILRFPIFSSVYISTHRTFGRTKNSLASSIHVIPPTLSNSPSKHLSKPHHKSYQSHQCTFRTHTPQIRQPRPPQHIRMRTRQPEILPRTISLPGSKYITNNYVKTSKILHVSLESFAGTGFPFPRTLYRIPWRRIGDLKHPAQPVGLSGFRRQSLCALHLDRAFPL